MGRAQANWGGLRASERGGGCAQVNWGGLRASEGQDIANAGHETVDEMDGQQGVQGVPRLRQALQRRDGPAPPLPRLRPPRLQALLARARRAGRALLHPLRDQIHAAGLDRVQAQGLPRRDGRGAAALGADLGPRPPASFRSAPLLGPRRLVRSPRGCFSDESRRRRGCDVDIRWRQVARRIFRRRVVATPWLRRGYFVETGACLRYYGFYRRGENFLVDWAPDV